MKMPIMDKLHDDHKNYAKLLNLMETLLADQKKGSDQGYFELYLIMKYMTNYPDIFHHPYEDIIFEEVEMMPDVDKNEIEKLKAEHKKIYDASKALLDELDAVVNDHIVEKDRIQELAELCSSSLRDHMNTEEAKVFPMINDKMTQASWNKISDSLKQVNDPIFDGSASDEYKLVFEQIVDES